MMQQPRYEDLPRQEGYRKSAIRESRIKDRPTPKTGASDSALKIKIELDLEIEVDLYARVKGDGMLILSHASLFSKLAEDFHANLGNSYHWVDVKVCIVGAIWRGVLLE